jgi:hypothetical protein
MKQPRLRRVTVLMLVGLLSAGSAGVGAQTRGTPPPAVSARARLTEAIAGAKRWKADAVLIQVANRLVTDGKAIMWNYGFWSPSAKACAVVNVAANGQSAADDAGDARCVAPELTEFMDSDKAFAAARANGITATRVSMVVSISDVKGVKRAVWTVMDEGGMKPGNVMLDLDATSGAVLSKTTQR